MPPTPLRQLLSEVEFHARLREEISRARRAGRSLSILAVRTPEGAPSPALLNRIRAKVREDDQISISGREALVILLPEANRAAARRFVQRLVKGLDADPPVSIGAVSYPIDGLSGVGLTERAMQLALRGVSNQGHAFHSEGDECDLSDIRVDSEIDLLAQSEEGRLLLRMLGALLARLGGPEDVLQGALELMKRVAAAAEGRIRIGTCSVGSLQSAEAVALLRRAEEGGQAVSEAGPGGTWVAFPLRTDRRPLGAVVLAPGRSPLGSKELAVLESFALRIGPLLGLFDWE